jgi:hypothetical protein
MRAIARYRQIKRSIFLAASKDSIRTSSAAFLSAAVSGGFGLLGSSRRATAGGGASAGLGLRAAGAGGAGGAGPRVASGSVALTNSLEMLALPDAMLSATLYIISLRYVGLPMISAR